MKRLILAAVAALMLTAWAAPALAGGRVYVYTSGRHYRGRSYRRYSSGAYYSPRRYSWRAYRYAYRRPRSRCYRPTYYRAYRPHRCRCWGPRVYFYYGY